MSLIYGVGYLFVRALSFLLLPLYTNILSIEDAGIVFIIYTTLAFLNTIYNHGMDSSLLKFFDEENREKIITTSIVYSLFFGLMFSVIIIILNYFFNDASFLYWVENHQYMVFFFCSVLFCDMISSRTMNVLRLIERPYYFLFVSFISVFVSFICNFYFIKFLDAGPEGVVMSLFIASLVQLFFLSPIIFQYFNPKSFDFSLLKKMLLFAFPFFPASLFFVLVELSDRWMLGWLSSIASVGLYGAGYKFGSLVMMVVLGFNLSWQPFYLKQNQNIRYLELIGNVFMITLVFISTLLSCFWPILIKVSFFGYSIIGENFWLGGEIIPIIAISYTFYGLFILQMPSIYIKNKQRWIPVIWGLGLIINLIGNYFLIQLLDFKGAAISSLLTYCFMSIFLFLKNRSWLPLSYDYYRFLKVVLFSAVMVLITSFENLYLAGFSISLYIIFIFHNINFFIKTKYE